MVLWGSVVNVLAIFAGSVFGEAIRFPEKVRDTIIQALGLAVVLIGISMGLETSNVVIPIAALVIGGIIGEVIEIEELLERFGKKLESRMQQRGSLTEGFLTATLVYCIGAMAVIGSLNSGLRGDHQILYAKSMLDGVTAVFFSASFGWLGVALSAIPVLIYQGSIALLADYLTPVMTGGVINELTATGGILIIGIGFNILGLIKVKVGNLLPALVVASILAFVF